MNLPVPPNQFDIVVCIGVIQHTPDPEKTISVLCSYLKPNGQLFIDHYSQDYSTTPIRKVFRFFLTRMKKEKSLNFVQTFTSIIWPLHKVFFRYQHIKGFGLLRRWFIYWSPIVDYQDAYPTLGSKLLLEWAILDTYDTLTDHYKHLRSANEIERYLKNNGMKGIEIWHGGNGVEARAAKSSDTSL